MQKPRITFIGAGNTCKVLGKLLNRKGYNIVGIASRRLESARKASRTIGAKNFSDKINSFVADADIVFITTPDDAIETLASNLAKDGKLRKGTIVLHCSGNYSSRILKKRLSSDINVASIHPIRSLANPNIVVNDFKGTFCAFEGDKKVIQVVEKIIRDIGGVPLKLKTNEKSLYHIGAVFASNYIIAIFEIALRLFEKCGIPRKRASRALLKLSKGTLANIEKVGIPKALTGPIERGDMKTITSHLSALKNEDSSVIYKALGKIAIDIAVSKKSITMQKANSLRKLLSL